MTDQEINEAVAIKLGYEKMHPHLTNYSKKISENQYVSAYPLPDFCNDIKAAWEIVENIKNTCLFNLWWHDGEWECNINDNEVCEKYELAPMVICRAFLKLP